MPGRGCWRCAAAPVLGLRVLLSRLLRRCAAVQGRPPARCAAREQPLLVLQGAARERHGAHREGTDRASGSRGRCWQVGCAVGCSIQRSSVVKTSGDVPCDCELLQPDKLAEVQMKSARRRAPILLRSLLRSTRELVERCTGSVWPNRYMHAVGNANCSCLGCCSP